MAFREIPIVDLSVSSPGSRDETALADELGRVCHEVGFFVVVDHGVDTALTDSVFSHMRELFALPQEDKELVSRRRSRHFRGWDHVGAESTNSRPDMREQFDVWTEWPALPQDTEPPHLRLLGPNQWLPDSLVPGHRRVFTAWIDQCSILASELLGLLSRSLGLDADHFEQLFGSQPMSLAKFIHYPPTPAEHAGVNAHHDAGFLTVLATGNTPGLQIENQNGEWIDVPLVPDSFVINLGEMLQAMTGNYLVATPHRVVASTERYSAGFFHGPSLDTELLPLSLEARYAEAVAASAHHKGAGFMTQRDETAAGVGAMRSSYAPPTYGEQLWNYFTRSYPDNVRDHYPDLIGLERLEGVDARTHGRRRE